ncbi:hypothetical protein Tco_0588398 [Tanacetum coccineum]
MNFYRRYFKRVCVFGRSYDEVHRNIRSIGEFLVWQLWEIECLSSAFRARRGRDSTYSKSNWRIEIDPIYCVVRLEGCDSTYLSMLQSNWMIEIRSHICVSRLEGNDLLIPSTSGGLINTPFGRGYRTEGNGITQEFETEDNCQDGTITRIYLLSYFGEPFKGTKVREEVSGSTTKEMRPVTNLWGSSTYFSKGVTGMSFAPRRPIPRKVGYGNMNGWLLEDEDEVERNEVDSDLESTASSKPVWEKTTKADRDRASYHYP